MRIFIHLLRGGGQFAIHLVDRARSRSKQIGHGFHGFHRAERLARRQFSTHLREFDKHNVAQGLLCVVGDADRRVVPVGLNPFVLFGVLAIRWICHKSF